MPHLDETGRDTELARYLHGSGRLDRNTLHGLLNEARHARPGGGTLARAIVQRGILPQAEVEASLTQIAAGVTAQLRPSGRLEPRPPASGSFGAVAPPPSSGHLRAVAPPPSSARLPAVSPGQGGRRASGSYTASGSNLVNSVAGPGSGNMRRSSGRFGTLNDGRVLGNYRILKPLGAGSMGQVYVAEHVETGARYALKTLLSTADEAFVARFLREGEAQAKVDSHANVLRVHDMGQERGFHYLVTELASGGDLKEVLRKQERLPGEGVTRLGRDLALGLAHMHAVGVLHRDMKPANILFDAEGVAKLADFGLARFEGAQSLTHTGDLVGTPVYMPPEQAMGLRDQVGPKSDVYGLGAILYNCVCGSPPFVGTTTIEVVDKLMNEQPQSLTSLVPETPPALAELIHSALAKEVEARPTAAELAQALDALLAPPEVAEPAKPARGPLPLLVGGAVLSLALLAGLFGFLATRGDPVAPPADVSTAGPQESAVVVVEPEPSEPEVLPVGLVWPAGVERRYRLYLKAEGEFPVSGMLTMMSGGKSQVEMRFMRTYELVFWHEPAPAEQGEPAEEAPPEDDESDEEWDDEHDDWDEGVSEAPEPMAEPGVTRLKVRIDEFAIDWEAMGMAKAYDSKEADQGEDGKRYSRVLGKVFTVGMRSDGEVVWVRGTGAIQDAIYGAGDAAESEGGHGRGRGRGMMQMRMRMSFHVPELGMPHVMRHTLNTFFHVLPPAGDEEAWERELPAPWSIGAGWGGRGGGELAPPDIPCAVTARSGSRKGTLGMTWEGDNAERVAEELAEGRVLLRRRASGRSDYEDGVLRSSELYDDSYFGEFEVESSGGGGWGGWGGQQGGQQGGSKLRRVKGEQRGRLKLLQ